MPPKRSTPKSPSGRSKSNASGDSNLKSSKSISKAKHSDSDKSEEDDGKDDLKAMKTMSVSLSDVNLKLSLRQNKDNSSDSSNSSSDTPMPPKSPKWLARIEEVDPCFHFAYVPAGYRTNYEFMDTLVSVFEMHNETMNIWSHLLGFFAVVLAGLFYLTENVRADLIDDTEFYLFVAYLVAASLCLLFSAVFHWFCCLSPLVYDKLLVLDLSGVALLVAGSYFPAVYYGFYCMKDLQTIHFNLASFVLIVGLSAPWITYTVNGVLIRPYILAFLGCLGVCPFINWILVTPAVARDGLAWGYYIVFILYGLGFWFWSSKYPEKKFPNSYIATYWMSSHTLWHLCVVAAVFWWFRHIHNSREFFKDPIYGGCKAYDNPLYNQDTYLHNLKSYF